MSSNPFTPSPAFLDKMKNAPFTQVDLCRVLIELWCHARQHNYMPEDENYAEHFAKPIDVILSAFHVIKGHMVNFADSASLLLNNHKYTSEECAEICQLTRANEISQDRFTGLNAVMYFVARKSNFNPVAANRVLDDLLLDTSVPVVAHVMSALTLEYCKIIADEAVSLKIQDYFVDLEEKKRQLDDLDAAIKRIHSAQSAAYDYLVATHAAEKARLTELTEKGHGCVAYPAQYQSTVEELILKALKL